METTEEQMVRSTMILAAIAAATLAVVGHTGAHAQSQPPSQKPLYIIVPYGPGGLPDGLARVVGQKLSENTGQQVIIENKPGASGIIGAQYFLSKASPDGNTLFVLDNNTYAINAAIYPNLVYNPTRDFAAVTQAIQGPMYLVTNSASEANSVQELITLAKNNPGRLNYGSPGNATLHHLGMEQLMLMSGVKMTHIPYKGVAQATPGLLAGDVTAMFASLTSVSQHAKAGKLKILAVGSTQRSSLTPDIPTVAESGFPGFEVAANMGFATHAAVPRPVIDRLNAELVKVLKSPEVASRLEAFGVKTVGSTPDQFAATIVRDKEAYTKLVRETHLKVD
jgi:tripartite-type tricarboxylate transporter receptor subunit TctC